MADGPVSADGFCQSALEDTATADAELQGGSQASAGSRPDVVSSNLPRTRVDLQPQPRQQDDDDDDVDGDDDENDEMSREPPASSVDEQLNNEDRQPPPSPPSPPPSAAANLET